MNQDLSISRTRTTKIPTKMFLKRKKKEKKKKEKTNPNLNTRTTFSFSVFHPLIFIKTHTIPSSLSLFSSLPHPLKSTPQANMRKKKAVNLRLIPFWLVWVWLRLDFVRTYVIHLLGTYVTILCNWLILWQNALYL